MPSAFGARVGKGTGSSGCSGGGAEDLAVNMIDPIHLGVWLIAAHRQLEAVRIEVNLHGAQSAVFVPAMRVAPGRQIEPCRSQAISAICGKRGRMGRPQWKRLRPASELCPRSCHFPVTFN